MPSCEAHDIPGFIQQLTIAYFAKGYWFYVTGEIPQRKDPTLVDSKLIRLYGIDESKWIRARRKQKGLANVRYLRLGHFFVLVATRGEHVFFRCEKDIRDIRRSPLSCFGYTIGAYQRSDASWHPSVRINQEDFRELRRYFGETAVKRTVEDLRHQIHNLPFEPYAPVRQQLIALLREINRARVSAGLDKLPFDALRLKRRNRTPFKSGANDACSRREAGFLRRR